VKRIANVVVTTKSADCERDLGEMVAVTVGGVKMEGVERVRVVLENGVHRLFIEIASDYFLVVGDEDATLG
jgi:archaellum component FlaG (FlaF/FlaG flagellin family)